MSQRLKNQNFKVVLLGRGCAGKTSIVLRYCKNKFNESHISTLQASFLTRKITVNGVSVSLNIWDTAGQERFHCLGPLYYRDSNGAVIVYDVSDNESYVKAKVWIQELRNILGNKVCIALIGNKCDLLKSINNSTLISEAQAYCKTLDKATHYLTSAKLNQGLDEMFLDLTRRMIEFQRTNLTKSPSLTSSSFGTGNPTLQIADEDETSTDEQIETRKCNC